MAEFSEPHSHNSLVKESCHTQRDNSNLGMQHGIQGANRWILETPGELGK